MHFGDDYPFQEPTLDRAAAEEALLIAARLQHVEKERLTVSDLKRSAAELNIDPEAIDKALILMHASRRESFSSKRKLRFIDVVWMSVLWGVESFIFLTVITNRFVEMVPLWLGLIIVPAVLGSALPSSRRLWKVIVLAMAFGALMALMSGWKMYLDQGLALHAAWTVPLAIFIQVAVFGASQWISGQLSRRASFSAQEQ